VQIKPEQLDGRLQQALAPVYFISGDEPLRVIEAADAVRSAARRDGYTEREVLTVQSGFDWNALTSAAGNLSLFAERRLIELRLPGGKPGDSGSRALRAWAEQPPQDTLLLVTAGRLDQNTRRSKWLQALDAAGVVVFVWPLDADRFPAWVRARMQQRGLEPATDAVTLLAERVEGNLLACMQEIDKLYLLQGAGPVSADDVLAAVTGSARYDVYGLVDSALAGDAARSVRILQGLRGEGVAPPVVLWALSKDIRQLVSMAAVVARGESVSRVLARFHVWQNRKPQFSRALNRLPGAAAHELLRRCARLDRVIKGQAAGNDWDELLQLTLQLAGADTLPVNDDPDSA
jgi:DNA polymerase-3 subunit delta